MVLFAEKNLLLFPDQAGISKITSAFQNQHLFLEQAGISGITS